MLIQVIIFLFFAANVCLYIFVSIKEKSFINFLLPNFLLNAPLYILEILYNYYYPEHRDIVTYTFVLLVYFTGNLFLVISYFAFPKIKVASNPKKIVQGFIPYLFLLVSYLLFLPIIIEYKEYLTQPRYIYEMAKGKSGLIFFLSSTTTYLAIILFLFRQNVSLKGKVFFYSLCLGILFFHGSKIHIVYALLIMVLYYAYVDRVKFNMFRFARILIVMTSVILILFVFTFKGIGSSSFLQEISRYSDYIRNSVLVIDDNPNHTMGLLTFEEQVFSRVPRAIYREKPRDFGAFYLASIYFPEAFRRHQGYPAFGIGLLFYDFGYFSIFVIALYGIFGGILLKCFITKLGESPHPSHFIMVIFASGISLIPIGAGYLIFEHALLAIIIYYLVQKKIVLTSH